MALTDANPETLRAACLDLEVETGYEDYRKALADPNAYDLAAINEPQRKALISSVLIQ